MRKTRAEQLEIAKAALHAGRDLSKLGVYPGPRGADTVRNGQRRRGRHLYWYIGEFQRRPGISGPVKCDEVPTFRTESEAKTFLNDVKDMSDTNTNDLDKRLQEVLAFFLTEQPTLKMIADWRTNTSEALQDFVGSHLRPSIQWSTAIGAIEAAQHMVEAAIENANIDESGQIEAA